MSTTQPEALRLADWLESVGGGPSAKRCAELLREQHARIAELEAELVKESARTADQKLRADQMTEQHRMQAAMNKQARAELDSAAQPPAGFVLVPVEPTPAMVDAAAEAHMPFGDMHLAVQMAILAASSSGAPKGGET